MSVRSRARRPWQVKGARGGARLPAVVTVLEAIEARPPAPAKPVDVVLSQETDDEREARLRQEAAARLPYSIRSRQQVRYMPAVPLNELEAWLTTYYPKVWVAMQSLEAKKPRRRKA